MCNPFFGGFTLLDEDVVGVELISVRCGGGRKRKYTEIQAEKDLKSRRHFNKKKNRHTPLWARG